MATTSSTSFSSCGVSQEDKTVLVDALQSLYRDEIRPHQSELLRRLRERGASSFLQQHYISICNKNDRYVVRTIGKGAAAVSPPPGIESLVSGNYVYFKSDLANWVDPKDTTDNYPTHVWRSFLLQVSRLMRADSQGKRPEGHDLQYFQFKGGRYGMAAELHRSAPDELKDISLGRYCHLVQLAISYGFLSYENSLLQPCSACNDLTRALISRVETNNENDISTKLPTSSSACAQSSREAAIMWRNRILVLLKDWPQGLVLAQFRKRVQDRFGDIIQPTNFGFTKLQQVLTAEPFVSALELYEDCNSRLILRTRRRSIGDTKATTHIKSKPVGWSSSSAITIPTPSKNPATILREAWEVTDMANITFNHWMSSPWSAIVVDTFDERKTITSIEDDNKTAPFWSSSASTVSGFYTSDEEDDLYSLSSLRKPLVLQQPQTQPQLLTTDLLRQLNCKMPLEDDTAYAADGGASTAQVELTSPRSKLLLVDSTILI
eukprot:TRINITY_DN178411_c0_g1_i1.p1 TRINITY_DN178411_c0_g1~~TRINITY_DN178411_c0_g1_i1.p1  ORF type:complete len:492 (+),score=31.61 TRINITY_DN178411_c0_g1_i1:217-1692(+)